MRQASTRYTSGSACAQQDTQCRGGIPVCFPQFGGFGPLAQHGFARNSEFTLVSGGSTSVTLSLQTNEDHLKLFPHPFELRVTVHSLPRPGLQVLAVLSVP